MIKTKKGLKLKHFILFNTKLNCMALTLRLVFNIAFELLLLKKLLLSMIPWC